MASRSGTQLSGLLLSKNNLTLFYKLSQCFLITVIPTDMFDYSYRGGPMAAVDVLQPAAAVYNYRSIRKELVL